MRTMWKNTMEQRWRRKKNKLETTPTRGAERGKWKKQKKQKWRTSREKRTKRSKASEKRGRDGGGTAGQQRAMAGAAGTWAVAEWT